MENPFTLARIRKLQSLSYIEINELTCHDFLRSEIEWLIRETPLRDEDKHLCVSLFIECKTNQEIADEYSFSIDTAKRTRKRLHDEMILTIVKMFFQYE